MANNKIYTVVKDGEELEKLKTLTAAKKLADAEGAEVYCDERCVYQGVIPTVEEPVEEPAVDQVGEQVEEPAKAEKAEEPAKSVKAEKPKMPVIYRLKTLMNVRSEPSFNGRIVGTRDGGTLVSVTEVKNDWLCVDDGTFILYGRGEFAEKV